MPNLQGRGASHQNKQNKTLNWRVLDLLKPFGSAAGRSQGQMHRHFNSAPNKAAVASGSGCSGGGDGILEDLVGPGSSLAVCSNACLEVCIQRGGHLITTQAAPATKGTQRAQLSKGVVILAYKMASTCNLGIDLYVYQAP